MKTPLTFSSQGREISRGTTLVQLPVTRSALKASNKAAAINGAYPSLPTASGSEVPLRDQLSTIRPHTGSHHPPAL